MKNKKLWTGLILVTIIAIGLFVRVYNIDHIPPGIYPDEAMNGEDAIHALKTGDYRWFYTANNGREGLFMNLIAISFKIFGTTILGLKFPSIIFGTLAIWGTYLLTFEIFRKRSTALIAAFLIALSFWPINFSRIAFRAIMLPAILSFSFYFLWKGMQNRKLWPFVWGGLIFGIGFHTYIAFRIAPAILIITLLSFWLNEKDFWKKYWKNILVFILACLITTLPMLYTFYAHPEYFDSRSEEVSIFSTNLNQGHLFQTFLRSFSLSLVKYNFWGDQNWRHNYPPYPILDPLTGIAFLFGFIYSIVRFFRLLFRRLKRHVRIPEMDIHTFFLAWFFIMLSPEFLTAEGLPHALRSIGTLPIIFIFAAWSFQFLLEKIKGHSFLTKKLNLIIIIILLALVGIFNFIKYQVFWANQEKVALSFNKNLADMARDIQSLPESEEKFVVTSWNRLENAPIDILTQDENVRFFYPDELDRINPSSQSFIIFFTENNQEAIENLSSRFPSLVLEKITNPPGSTYYVLR